MKITANQLRKIIRETVEEVKAEAELDEMGGITPEEFEAIVTESTVRIPLKEDFGILTITLGTVLGILAYKAGKAIMGSAAEAAAEVAYDMSVKAQAELRAKARAAAAAKLDEAVLSLADDAELAGMFQQLAALKSTGTSAQVSALSKQITSYVKAHMSQTGADPMDVRKALGKRY